MPYKKIRDILNRAIEFHKLMVDFYSRIKDESEKENVKLLVDYMARHENILKENLSRITEEQAQQITDAWVKFDPEYAAFCCFDDMKIDKNSGVDDIIDVGLRLNQCLIDLYHQMTEMTLPEEVKALFSNLEVMEIAEKKKLARTRGM